MRATQVKNVGLVYKITVVSFNYYEINVPIVSVYKIN